MDEKKDCTPHTYAVCVTLRSNPHKGPVTVAGGDARVLLLSYDRERDSEIVMDRAVSRVLMDESHKDFKPHDLEAAILAVVTPGETKNL